MRCNVSTDIIIRINNNNVGVIKDVNGFCGREAKQTHRYLSNINFCVCVRENVLASDCRWG